MSLYYRVVAFGKPRGPWRATSKQAEVDAAGQELGCYDEWGMFFTEAFAEIESAHEYDLMRRGEGHRAMCTKRHDQGSLQVRRRA